MSWAISSSVLSEDVRGLCPYRKFHMMYGQPYRPYYIRKSQNKNVRALSIQPQIPVISVGTSKGTDHFGLVRPEYSGPALKVVHCDRSGYFGRSDQNVPFHLPKLLSPVPLFSILLTRPSSFQWKVKCCE